MERRPICVACPDLPTLTSARSWSLLTLDNHVSDLEEINGRSDISGHDRDVSRSCTLAFLLDLFQCISSSRKQQSKISNISGSTDNLAPRRLYAKARSRPTPELAPSSTTRSSCGLMMVSLLGSGRVLRIRCESRMMGSAARATSHAWLDGIGRQEKSEMRVDAVLAPRFRWLLINPLSLSLFDHLYPSWTPVYTHGAHSDHHGIARSIDSTTFQLWTLTSSFFSVVPFSCFYTLAFLTIRYNNLHFPTTPHSYPSCRNPTLHTSNNSAKTTLPLVNLTSLHSTTRSHLKTKPHSLPNLPISTSTESIESTPMPSLPTAPSHLPPTRSRSTTLWPLVET